MWKLDWMFEKYLEHYELSPDTKRNMATWYSLYTIESVITMAPNQQKLFFSWLVQLNEIKTFDDFKSWFRSIFKKAPVLGHIFAKFDSIRNNLIDTIDKSKIKKENSEQVVELNDPTRFHSLIKQLEISSQTLIINGNYKFSAENLSIPLGTQQNLISLAAAATTKNVNQLTQILDWLKQFGKRIKEAAETDWAYDIIKTLTNLPFIWGFIKNILNFFGSFVYKDWLEWYFDAYENKKADGLTKEMKEFFEKVDIGLKTKEYKYSKDNLKDFKFSKKSFLLCKRLMQHEDYKDYKHEDLFNLFFKNDSKFLNFVEKYNTIDGIKEISIDDGKWKLDRKGFEDMLEKYVKMENEEEYEEKEKKKIDKKTNKSGIYVNEIMKQNSNMIFISEIKNMKDGSIMQKIELRNIEWWGECTINLYFTETSNGIYNLKNIYLIKNNIYIWILKPNFLINFNKNLDIQKTFYSKISKFSRNILEYITKYAVELDGNHNDKSHIFISEKTRNSTMINISWEVDYNNSQWTYSSKSWDEWYKAVKKWVASY